jgi:hypothetical protein
MGTSTTGALARRIDAGTWPLAVGDLVAIVAFAALGIVNHSGTDFLLANPTHLALVAAPFLLGWLAFAPLVGAYSPGAGESAKAAVPLAVRSWIPAAVVGLALRATPVFPGGFAVTFAVVSLVVGAVFLAVPRLVFFRLV